jgi:hypothetical protein
MLKKLMLLISLSIILIAGCSQRGIDSPLIPSNNDLQIQPDTLPVIGSTTSEDMTNAIGILGGFELVLDTTGMKADLHPLRSSTAIGDSYIVSGAGFFTVSPCQDCLRIKSIELDENENPIVTFYIEHPFKPGDVNKPPTWLNRLDLDVFDVSLVIKPQGFSSETFPYTGRSVYTGIIADQSGYTRELRNVTGDDNAMPYILVVDDDQANLSTYNKFEMGASRTFNVKFDFGQSENVTMDLYLTMGYGHSAKKPQRLNPTYYNPEFNKKSPWKVRVLPPNGLDAPSMDNTWNDRDSSTPFNVQVMVFDWQIGATVNPDLTSQTDIYEISEISSVSVEIPGMTGTLPTITTPSMGTGMPGNPLVFDIPVANELMLGAGEYTGLVKVLDTRNPRPVIAGSEPDTLVHTEDGVKLEWYEIPEYATYQTFTAAIVSGCGPVTGQITTPAGNLTGIYNGQMVNFTASASSANGGDPIALYEWDMDYDSQNFSVDETGQNVVLGPFTNPTCGGPNSTPFTYTVAVRAKDSCTPPNIEVIDTCQVTVGECTLPTISNPSIVVNRYLVAEDYPIDPTGPFTLSWDGGNPNIVQYAIYVDRNPADGLTNNLIYVGKTSGTSFTCPPAELPGNHYIPGYTYIVRPRTVMNDPSSEGPDSEMMHVIVTGFETLSSAVVLDGEGWLANCEGTNTSKFYRPQVSGTNRAHGNRSVHFSEFVGMPTLTGRWNGMIIGPIPSIPNSSVRFLDFSVYWKNLHDGGMFIGTCAAKPSTGWTTPQTDFDASLAAGLEGMYGYTTFDSNICAFFNGCMSTENNTWYIPSDLYTHRHVGGDANLSGNPNHPYLGIECFRNSFTSSLASNIYLDEVAIAIY